ncbi:hypothetical protein RDI58_004383 [Solanum bulbocastanum]|uniref:Flavodoxin-like domain-containing protein n=1 Tax=Solanum bulbocastanum TaxID=147425 RepID=A0AAN8U6F2_SOLBU
MEKGGSCVPSKKKISKSTSQNPPPIPSGELDSTTNDAVFVTEHSIDSLLPANTQNLKSFIIFYSMYGHVESLARRMKKLVKAVEGVDVVLYRVPEG